MSVDTSSKEYKFVSIDVANKDNSIEIDTMCKQGNSLSTACKGTRSVRLHAGMVKDKHAGCKGLDFMWA